MLLTSPLRLPLASPSLLLLCHRRLLIRLPPLFVDCFFGRGVVATAAIISSSKIKAASSCPFPMANWCVWQTGLDRHQRRYASLIIVIFIIPSPTSLPTLPTHPPYPPSLPTLPSHLTPHGLDCHFHQSPPSQPHLFHLPASSSTHFG